MVPSSIFFDPGKLQVQPQVNLTHSHPANFNAEQLSLLQNFQETKLGISGAHFNPFISNINAFHNFVSLYQQYLTANFAEKFATMHQASQLSSNTTIMPTVTRKSASSDIFKNQQLYCQDETKRSSPANLKFSVSRILSKQNELPKSNSYVESNSTGLLLYLSISNKFKLVYDNFFLIFLQKINHYKSFVKEAKVV